MPWLDNTILIFEEQIKRKRSLLDTLVFYNLNMFVQKKKEKGMKINTYTFSYFFSLDVVLSFYMRFFLLTEVVTYTYVTSIPPIVIISNKEPCSKYACINHCSCLERLQKYQNMNNNAMQEGTRLCK